jgi:ssRNA-specific RNase YbeY (16S rRNA maturation enzyme)
LHACGLDHDRASDAAQMESLEIAILKRFRIPNPYL